MASFLALDSYPSVQVTSGTQVQNVEVVTAATIPTGIQFTYAIPRSVWVDNNADSTLTAISDYLETLVTGHHVTGGSPSQDFDVNNLLADYVDLIVSYNRDAQGLGPLTGMASVPIVSILLTAEAAGSQGFGGFGGYVDPALACDNEYARLAALAQG